MASVSGLPVYDHASAARGSFWGIIRFLYSKRFAEREPAVLVWGVIEREISGAAFEGLRYSIYVESSGKKGALKPRRAVPGPLLPHELKKGLPATSILAMVSRKAWNRLRYEAFGQLNPEVIAATDHSMLFYRGGLVALRWPDEIRGVPQVADVVAQVNEMLRARGVSLVLVLIPSKERIHRDRLPEECVSARYPLPPSVLDAVEEALRGRGVSVVNLLPAFERKAREGRVLFWPDDTHWNSEGIRLASEETWKVVEPLVRQRNRAPQ
jgi:hypothetical protein